MRARMEKGLIQVGFVVMLLVSAHCYQPLKQHGVVGGFDLLFCYNRLYISMYVLLAFPSNPSCCVGSRKILRENTIKNNRRETL